MSSTAIAAASQSSGSTRILEAEGLVPLLREQAPLIEDRRRLTPEVHAALLNAGFYRLTMPPEFSGAEATLPEIMRVLEILAHGDASTAWNVWASCGVPAMSAFISEEGARELFSAREACLAASVAGMGKAVAVPGGYRVSGRWSFVSGIHQATHTGGTCFVFDGDVQRMGPDGEPLVVVPLWPVQACSVRDVWDTTGLRGTGSNEIAVRDLFVPDRLVVDFSCEPRAGLPPLYAVSNDNAANVTVAALALGIAGAAVAAFRALGPQKKQMDGSSLADAPLTKAALAVAETRLAQARGHLYETVEIMWEELVDGTYAHERWFPRTSLASVAAVDAAIEVVTGLYREAGSSAIFRSRGFDRCLRDIFTLGAHKTVQHLNLVQYGGATFAPAA